MLAARFQPYLFAVLAVATLAAFTAFDLKRERDRSVAQAKAHTANLARLIEQQTVQLLARVDAALDSFGTRLAWSGPGAGAASRPGAAATSGATRPTSPVGRKATEMPPSDGLIRALYLLDGEGRPLHAVAEGGPAPALDAAFLADWRPRALASAAGQPVLGKPWRDAAGQWAIPVSRAHLNPDPPAAVQHLVALVDLGALQPLLDSVDTGKNGFVTLFLRDGWMLATAPRNDALFARNWMQTPMFQEHLTKAPTGTVQQVVVRDRTERIYSYRMLPRHPVVVSTGISMTDALAEWRARGLADVVLLLAVASAALWGALVLSRNYARRASAELAAASAAQRAEQSERFVRGVTDNLPMRIAYVDRALRYRFVNKAHCDRFERPRDAILGRTREELTGQPLPADLQPRIDAVLRGQAQRFEHEEGTGGTARVVETFLVADAGPEGEVQGFFAASTDVTERHLQQRAFEQALAERETLLREVYHRVKNNLQVVQSLLNIQRRTVPEGPALAALDDSVRRVHAMALVHERLYQADHLDAVSLPGYVAELLRYLGETGNAARRGVLLQAEIEEIHASLEVAMPLGLLVTELVTNSLKHGFPGGRTGSVRVSLDRRGTEVWLQVRDDGVGLPQHLLKGSWTSMGLQLAASLAGQLGGQLQAAEAQGAVFSAHLARLD